MNVVCIMGRLTRDPEVKYSANNNAICRIGIAVDDVYKKSKGEKESAMFFDATAFGAVGENINKYLHKGDPILLQGELSQDRWEDKDGNKRSKVQIKVFRFDFVGRKKDRQAGAGDKPAGGYSSGGPHQPVDQADIPFAPGGIDGRTYG